MKKSIGIIAALLLSSASLFASDPAKAIAKKYTRNEIKIEAMRKDLRVGISVERSEKGQSFLKITDKNRNVVFEDFLTTRLAVEKAYNISELEIGDYTISVTSNGVELNRIIHVYQDGDHKTYFFFED